jgi:hypothetical protein
MTNAATIALAEKASDLVLAGKMAKQRTVEARGTLIASAVRDNRAGSRRRSANAGIKLSGSPLVQCSRATAFCVFANCPARALLATKIIVPGR